MARAHGVEAIDELAKKYSGGERFIKLGDGELVKVAFLGEPFAREIVWIGNKSHDFDENNPEHDADEARLLISWNCYDAEKQKVRVFDQGVTFYRKWLKSRDRFGLQRWYEIERDGTGKKTTYNLYKDDRIDDATWKDLQALKLHTLERSDNAEGESEDSEGRRPASEKAKAQSKGNGADAELSSELSSGNGIIDAELAKDLAQRLKELPEESIDKFLGKFGVERIKELPSASAAAAIAFVEALETMRPAAAPKKRAIDPFE